MCRCCLKEVGFGLDIVQLWVANFLIQTNGRSVFEWPGIESGWHGSDCCCSVGWDGNGI